MAEKIFCDACGEEIGNPHLQGTRFVVLDIRTEGPNAVNSDVLQLEDQGPIHIHHSCFQGPVLEAIQELIQ